MHSRPKLSDGPVGEEWAQVKKQFEIGEKKMRPTLRIFVTMPKIKVWLDDVEVRAATR